MAIHLSKEVLLLFHPSQRNCYVECCFAMGSPDSFAKPLEGKAQKCRARQDSPNTYVCVCVCVCVCVYILRQNC